MSNLKRSGFSIFLVFILTVFVSPALFAGQTEIVWEKTGSMPEKLSNTAVVTHLGKIYVSGGNNEKGSTAGFYEFDPGKNEWKKLPEMSTPRYGHCSFVYRNRIYVLGGLKTAKGADVCLDSIEAYDFVLKKWVPEGKMAKPLARFGVTGYKLGMMVTGGIDEKGAVSGDVYYFYPPGNQWDKMPELPVAVNRHCSVTASDCYVIGGENREGKALASVYRFDEKTEKWFAATPLKQARKNAGACVNNQDIIVAGGWDTRGKTRVFISQTEIMDAGSKRFANDGNIEPGRDGCRIAAVRGKIYLIGGFSGIILGDVFTGTVSKPESGWEIDDALTFNLAYLNMDDKVLNDKNSYSVKPVNFAGEFKPDITNIVLKNIFALGFPLPDLKNAADLTLYLKFYEYPKTLNQTASANKVLGNLLVYKTINGGVLQQYLKDKAHVQIKMAHIEKTGFDFNAEHPYPALRVSKAPIPYSGREGSLKPQELFDSFIPFSSLYVKPAGTMPKGLSEDEQAKWSTGGVVAFHKEILGLYRKHLREITGPDKDKFYFINENAGYDSFKNRKIVVIRVPKEPIIITGYKNADMPQDPKRIKLSGLLLVYRGDWNIKPGADIKKVKDFSELEKAANHIKDHVFEVGSVVKL
ncbi:MAG: hypothetical protein LWY06_13985 [Firmicutes bacterium]|nr:hypothetical protein [Bacillota bacterium]